LITAVRRTTDVQFAVTPSAVVIETQSVAKVILYNRVIQNELAINIINFTRFAMMIIAETRNYSL